MQKENSSLNRKDKTAIGTFGISLLLHAALFLVIGSYVIFEGVVPKTPFITSGELVTVDQELVIDTPDILPDIPEFSPEMPNFDPSSSDASPDAGSPVDLIISSAPSTAYTMPAPMPGAIATGTIGRTSGMGGGGGGPGGTTRASSFFETPLETKRIVFLIDISGSMVIQPRSTSTWNTLEQELERALAGLGGGAEFNLVGFAGESATFRGRPVPATPDNIRNAMSWISKQSPAQGLPRGATTVSRAEQPFSNTRWGGTAAHLALAEAFDMSPDTIVLLSDGDPTFPGNSLSVRLKDKTVVNSISLLHRWVQEQQSALQTPVTIHSVSYLAEGGENFMRDLATQNNGTYRQVK